MSSTISSALGEKNPSRYAMGTGSFPRYASSTAFQSTAGFRAWQIRVHGFQISAREEYLGLWEKRTVMHDERILLASTAPHGTAEISRL